MRVLLIIMTRYLRCYMVTKTFDSLTGYTYKLWTFIQIVRLLQIIFQFHAFNLCGFEKKSHTQTHTSFIGAMSVAFDDGSYQIYEKKGNMTNMIKLQRLENQVFSLWLRWLTCFVWQRNYNVCMSSYGLIWINAEAYAQKINIREGMFLFL